MAPAKFISSKSLSPPTVWGIDTYMHPSKTLNMERSREEEDEQLRRGGEERPSQNRVQTIQAFGVFKPIRMKRGVRDRTILNPTSSLNHWKPQTYFLRFQVEGATGRRDGCHGAQITLGKREKRGNFSIR